MKITLEQLRGLKACASQVTAFQEAFGDEVEVSEAVCVAHAGTFNWMWAAEMLLPHKARDTFMHNIIPSTAIYCCVIRDLWVEYLADCKHNGSPIMDIIPWADQNMGVQRAKKAHNLNLARAFAAIAVDATP